MKLHALSAIRDSVFVAAVCLVGQLSHGRCTAQDTTINTFTNQGYYGSVYDPWYDYGQTYSPNNGAYRSRSGYRVNTLAPIYTPGPFERGYAASFGTAGPFMGNQMGPNINSINGPGVAMFGPYTRTYRTPYATMTYYGPYGFRGFDP